MPVPPPVMSTVLPCTPKREVAQKEHDGELLEEEEEEEEEDMVACVWCVLWCGCGESAKRTSGEW